MKRRLLPAALALLAMASSARAFTRSRDANTGVCTYWAGFGMSWYLNGLCSDDLEFSACENTVRTSFETWNSVECSRFAFNYLGTTSRSDIGFDQENWDNNINLVLFIENDWPHSHNAIGLTTTTYDASTGELVDADLEMNGQYFTFSNRLTPPAGRTDLQNTVTHEAGHMLGLDHSSNPEATMYDTAPPGDTAKRTLHADDIQGICFIYPNSGNIPPYTDMTERETCSGAEEEPSCSCTSARNSWSVWLLVLAAFADLFRRRRRTCAR